MARSSWQLSAFPLVGALVIASCTSPSSSPGSAATTAPPATATPGPVAATQPCATGGLSLSSIEAPAATTAPAAVSPTARPATTPTAAASPRPSPTATPTLRPAPTTDRVGFPEGYQTAFKFGYVYDRKDAKSISYICLNDVAASTRQGQPFAFGSVIVFESWRPKLDAQGNAVLDSAGHMIRSTLNAIFVMRKEQGFGVDYKQFQTGDWEYIAYRPDKTHQTAPQGTGACAACHSAGSNKERDWTFRGWELPFTTRRAEAPIPGLNEVSLNRMAFFPSTLNVPVGTTVKWTNSAVDKVDHTVTANDLSFNSGTLKPGAPFSSTFAKAGTFAYFCSLHPEQMRATVVVK